MFCARCGKTFGIYEPRIYAVLPGRPGKKLPTCYDDRLCESRKTPIIVVSPALFRQVVNIDRQAKYHRRYKFKGR